MASRRSPLISVPEDDIDESNVVILNSSKFNDVLEGNRYVMVVLYDRWCMNSLALKQDYAKAATELKAEEVVLAKVDLAVETDLAFKYNAYVHPTILFFVDGVAKQYDGPRYKDAIVTWVKRKIGSGLVNITTTEEAEYILTDDSPVVVAYVENLVGLDSKELAAASKQEEEVSFYQTSSADLAKLFHIDPQGKRPALVLLKTEDEKVTHFGGEFKESAITEFVGKNKLPLVLYLNYETTLQLFKNPIKNEVILFTTLNDNEKFLPIFQEAAKDFLGKALFLYALVDDAGVGKSAADSFDIYGDAPRVVAFTGYRDARKFYFDGELTLNNIKSFCENFLQDNLKPFYKADPVPETNDGDVKIVVGNNFDEIVLDESKDVLLEVYAPWCPHCQELEPTYNKLAKHLKGIDSIVIAKMDGTTNEHPRATTIGFPNLIFFPAGNKSSDPIQLYTDRTVKAFYKFIKQHAAIPFELQKDEPIEESSNQEMIEG